MIEVRNLQKAYSGEPVVHIPSLGIAPGESFGLVGNNGAGKTTFFRMVLDLVRPEEREVLSKGVDVRQSEVWKQYTGSYLDESFLIDFLLPEEYFEFIGSLHGLSREATGARLEWFADFFNGEVLGRNKYIRDLSRGNQQKVGIAAAMLAEPEVLVLDEPFASLDPRAQIRLKELLLALQADSRVAMLISSHNLNHVTEVCERIAVLEKGIIVQDIQTSASTLADLEAYFTT